MKYVHSFKSLDPRYGSRMANILLLRQYNQYDDSELLAAGQALLIYILMRMVDGETEHNNFDIQLLVSLQVSINEADINMIL